MAVKGEPDPTQPAGDAEPQDGRSALERAAAAWGVDARHPGRCPAHWRRPGELWQCQRPDGHRWRHHFVRLLSPDAHRGALPAPVPLEKPES